MISAHTHDLIKVALVMGAYDLGILASPIWGIAAERYNFYRPLFFTGFAITALGTILMPLLNSFIYWFTAAFLTGVGNSCAATLATLFIVDFSPRSEWELRIGFLQSMNGGGQVAGLFLSAAFSSGSYGSGLLIAGSLLGLAMIIGRIGLPLTRPKPDLDYSRKNLHQVLDIRALAPFPRLHTTTGIALHINPLNVWGLRRLPWVLGTTFGRFLISWFMFALSVSAFFTYLPLMLDKSYGINPRLTASLYALSAAIGIGLFLKSSQWSRHYSSTKVYRFGLWLRVSGFSLLLLPGYIPLHHKMAIGITGFLIIVLAWPIISVSGTNLAARLSPFSEGAAIGLFNASLALATVIGTFASGPLVRWWGYYTIPIIALLNLLAAILLTAGLDQG